MMVRCKDTGTKWTWCLRIWLLAWQGGLCLSLFTALLFLILPFLIYDVWLQSHEIKNKHVSLGPAPAKWALAPHERSLTAPLPRFPSPWWDSPHWLALFPPRDHPPTHCIFVSDPATQSPTSINSWWFPVCPFKFKVFAGQLLLAKKCLVFWPKCPVVLLIDQTCHSVHFQIDRMFSLDLILKHHGHHCPQ